MRRTIVFAAVVVLALAIAAPRAVAKPPLKGCPPGVSVWTQVNYVLSPYTNWQSTGFWRWYWAEPSDRSAAVQDAWEAYLQVETVDEVTQQAIYEGLAGSISTVDLNHDLEVCVWWIGGTPMQAFDDTYISYVDNNTSLAAPA
jgi:hypothetical protein